MENGVKSLVKLHLRDVIAKIDKRIGEYKKRGINYSGLNDAKIIVLEKIGEMK